MMKSLYSENTFLEIYLEDSLKWVEEIRKMKENEFHVTEIIQCREKTNLLRKFPEISLKLSLEPSIIFGKIVHRGIQDYFRSKGYEVEKRIEKKIENYKIIGDIDILGENEVFEIKFTKAEPKEPYKHHELQVAIYKFLSGVENGYLIYIFPFGVKSFEVEREVSEADILELIENPKIPMWDWECDYCIFKNICGKRI